MAVLQVCSVVLCEKEEKLVFNATCSAKRRNESRSDHKSRLGSQKTNLSSSAQTLHKHGSQPHVQVF